ncbi:MAG: Uma2 family endonuclease [Candidatus Competibacteraceae bacterium]
MHWQQICEDPMLRNLPFKIETNRWGRIEMIPATNEHGLYQVRLIELLLQMLQNGRPIAECSIQTHDGVKVADVAWGSFEFFKRNKRNNPYQESPEIVIEILSPSNSVAEMEEKKELYFARGAQESWLCERDGRMRFFNNHQDLRNSELAPKFPSYIEIDFA